MPRPRLFDHPNTKKKMRFKKKTTREKWKNKSKKHGLEYQYSLHVQSKFSQLLENHCQQQNEEEYIRTNKKKEKKMRLNSIYSKMFFPIPNNFVLSCRHQSKNKTKKKRDKRNQNSISKIKIRSMFNQNFHNLFETLGSSKMKSGISILISNNKSKRKEKKRK